MGEKMELMGEKTEVRGDGIEKSMQNQYDGLEKSMQNQFGELRASLADLKVTVEKLYSENNQIRTVMLQQTSWQIGTLIAIAGVVIAAFKFLS